MIRFWVECLFSKISNSIFKLKALAVNHFWFAVVASFKLCSSDRDEKISIDNKDFKQNQILEPQNNRRFICQTIKIWTMNLPSDGSQNKYWLRRFKTNKNGHKENSYFWLICILLTHWIKNAAADFHSISHLFSAWLSNDYFYINGHRGLQRAAMFRLLCEQKKKESIQNDTFRTNISIRRAHAKDTWKSKFDCRTKNERICFFCFFVCLFADEIWTKNTMYTKPQCSNTRITATNNCSTNKNWFSHHYKVRTRIYLFWLKFRVS